MLEGKHKHCLPQNWFLGVFRRVHQETAPLRHHRSVKVLMDGNHCERHFQMHVHFYVRPFPVTLSILYPSSPLTHHNENNVAHVESWLLLFPPCAFPQVFWYIFQGFYFNNSSKLFPVLSLIFQYRSTLGRRLLLFACQQDIQPFQPDLSDWQF